MVTDGRMEEFSFDDKSMNTDRCNTVFDDCAQALGPVLKRISKSLSVGDRILGKPGYEAWPHMYFQD